MKTPRSMLEKAITARKATLILRRDVDMLGTYAGVAPAQVASWHTEGLLLSDGSLVRLERLDTISLHTFIRKARLHPSIRQIRPDVIRRAQEPPAGCRRGPTALHRR